MSVYKDWLDVIRTVLILLEAIIVLVWMDMNWNQIITLVQVIATTRIVFTLLTSWITQCNFQHHILRNFDEFGKRSQLC